VKYITVDGLTVEYRDIHPGKDSDVTLLLLHEGLGSAAMWRDFPDKLAAASACRTLVWTRAGYGGSSAYAGERTSAYLHREAEQALPAFLAALGIERPLLLGHSDGGSIALLFAAAFPDAPAGLIVMAPHEFVESQTRAGIANACLAWKHAALPQKLARYHPDAQQVFDDWSQTWLAPAFDDWSIVDELSRIRCPVLAIQGEDDEYASMRQIEVIAEHAPHTQLLKLAQCGHSPQRDQPAAVLSAACEFIRSLQT